MINGAIESEELTVESDVGALVEMLLAVLWGVGLYAGFVGSSHEELKAVINQLRRLFVGNLWHLTE